MHTYFVPHVEAVGGPERAFAIGATWLLEHAHEGVPFILVRTLRQASYSDVDELVSAGARSGIPKNFPPNDWVGGPVLAPWAKDKVIESIDRASQRVTSVCVLQWVESDCRPWLTAHEATDLTAPERMPPTPTIDDRVVLVALERLTHVVNLSTGLSHSLDRMRAIGWLEYLKRWGHHLDAEEVVSWALANGWSQAGAADLEKIINRVNAGGTFKGIRKSRIADRGSMRKMWKLEAERRDEERARRIQMSSPSSSRGAGSQPR